MKLVYVVADSISMHYGPTLEKCLAGKLAYDRKGGDEAFKDLNKGVGANGGDSRNVLNYLCECFANEIFKPDILLINCGLHDVKLENGLIQVPLDEYKENLQSIVALIQGHGPEMVWVRTTAVDDVIHNDLQHGEAKQGAFQRFEKDVTAYNAVADEVMKQEGVPVIDLYTFTCALGKNVYCDHVHYIEEVRVKQGEFVANELIKRFCN